MHVCRRTVSRVVASRSCRTRSYRWVLMHYTHTHTKHPAYHPRNPLLDCTRFLGDGKPTESRRCRYGSGSGLFADNTRANGDTSSTYVHTSVYGDYGPQCVTTTTTTTTTKTVVFNSFSVRGAVARVCQQQVMDRAEKQAADPGTYGTYNI